MRRRRGRGGAAIEELPNVEQTKNGVHVWSNVGWTLKKYNHPARQELWTFVKLAGASTEYNTAWLLTLTRRAEGRLSPGFVATLEYKPKSGPTEGPVVELIRAHCRGWEDAIDTVEAAADLPAAMAKTGEAMFGRGGEGWDRFRPFRVVYPWHDPEEPNAKFGPFKLCPGLLFDAETDGVVSCIYKQSGYAVRSAAEAHHANAYLSGPDSGGKYVVYHRDGMSTPDPIDIDNWRARMIAGTED